MSDPTTNELPTEFGAGSSPLIDLITAHLFHGFDQDDGALRCICGDSFTVNADDPESRAPHTGHVADVLAAGGYVEVPGSDVTLLEAVALRVDHRLPQRLTTGPGHALNNAQERAALETDGWPGARRVRASIIATDVMAMLAGRGLGDVRALEAQIAGENPHWHAFDAYVNSGYMDEQHKRVFFAYVDGRISREYMTSQLSTGMGNVPCDCDEQEHFNFTEFDHRPECEHCNRKQES